MKNTAAEPEVVATRKTADGVKVMFHADGQVSFVTYFLRGRLPLNKLWRVVGDICLYDAAEIPALTRRVRAGNWRPFRVSVPAPANAVYTSMLCANGLEIFIRLAR